MSVFLKPCAVCNKNSTQQCDSCRSIAWCSSKCQVLDSKLHLTVCDQFQEKRWQRPSSNHRLAFLFPADADAPELIWVTINEQKTGIKVPRHSALEPFKWTQPKGISVELNVLRNFELRHGLKVNFYGDEGSFHEREVRSTDAPKPKSSIASIGEINSSIRHITGGNAGYDWYGPVIVSGYGYFYPDFKDVSGGDLRAAADFFILRGHAGSGDVLKQWLHGKEDAGAKVTGVKVSCESEQEVYGSELCAPMEVSVSDRVFEEGVSPPISTILLGLKLLIRRIPSLAKWDLSSDYRHVNKPATYLNYCVDPEDEKWGYVPKEWQGDVGNLLVVREDKKPLTPKQVEALCQYCQFNLAPTFKETELRPKGIREEVNKKFITKEAFSEFFAEYRRWKIREGLEDWSGEILPCDV